MVKFNFRKNVIPSQLRYSFFWRFLSSYILLFLIPFCTILLTYNYASNSIKKSILDSNSNILYQFFSNVDAVFSEMSMVGMTLTNSQTIQHFSSHTTEELTKPTIDAYYLNKLINSFYKQNFEDIMVVFHNLSRIYDGRNGLSYDEFYQTHFKSSIPYSQYENLITHSYRNYKTEIISLNDNILNPVLGITFSQSASRSFHGASEITAVVTLSQAELQQLFTTSSLHSDGILMVLSGDKNLIAVSQPISEDVLSEYNTVNQNNYKTIQGKDYVIQFFPSKVTNCIYASAIPVSIFWEQLNNLRIVSMISMLLCILLSCFLSLKMARANYSPITGILNAITATTGKIRDNKKNEMDFIKDVLDNSLTQITTLTKKLELQVDTLRNNFLMQAMLGNFPENTLGTEDNAFLNHHISLISDMFGIILFYIEEVDECKIGTLEEAQNQLILEFIITNVMQEICTESHQGFLIGTEPRYYAYLINFKKDTNPNQQTADMYSISKRCSVFLKQHYGIIITWLLSDVHSNLPGLKTSYSETQKAQDYRYLYGKGSIITYQMIKDKRFDFVGVEDNKLDQLLLSYIKDPSCTKDSKQIVSEIQLMSGISAESSLEAISCFKYDLMIHYSSMIHQLGATCLPEASQLHNLVINAETFTEVLNYFTDALIVLQKFYHDTQKTYTICDEVEEYIEKNFQNPELSVAMLGDHFHITRSYLSHMFKMQKNVSILDSLNYLRIRNSKQLLEHSDDTLEDVAIKSGFLSSSTFIKAFKKNEGITPGVYRKLKQD